MERKILLNSTFFALAINAFAIGSAEPISVGLLPAIVESFYISLSQVGLIVSLYALGVTVEAPLLTILAGKWNRRSLMLGTILLFVSGSLVVAFAPTFTILLVGRILSALAHGIFTSASTVIVVDAVPPSRRTNAIAIMPTGLMVATVTGVSLGTFIGRRIAWRMSLLFIAGTGLVGLIASYSLVPKNLLIPGEVDLKGITRIFTNKPLVFPLLITAFGYGGAFAACMYLSSLLGNLGFSANAVVAILVAYGVMVVTGNTVGGHRTNKEPLDSLIKVFNLLILPLVFLFIIVLAGNSLLGLLANLMLGLFAFMSVPGLQPYVVKLTEKCVPEGITLALAFDITVFNIGATAGSTIDGTITDYLSVTHIPISGGSIVLIAVLLVLYTRKQEV